MIEINLLKLIPYLCMYYNYYSLTEHVVSRIEMEIKTIENINLKRPLDIYIECNSIYIIIETNCDTEFSKYFETEIDNIDINDIKNLLYELNEEINFCYDKGNINEGKIDENNILINKTEKKYILLSYYNSLISGEKYRIENNSSIITSLGNFIDTLLQKKYRNDIKEGDYCFKTCIPYNIWIKNKSFFLSKILEKIKKPISWDNYYFECKYNILNGRQKKSVCKITNKIRQDFFVKFYVKKYHSKMY